MLTFLASGTVKLVALDDMNRSMAKSGLMLLDSKLKEFGINVPQQISPANMIANLDLFLKVQGGIMVFGALTIIAGF